MKYTKGGEMPKELGSPIIFLFGASLSISLISIWTFQNKKKNYNDVIFFSNRDTTDKCTSWSW